MPTITRRNVLALLLAAPAAARSLAHASEPDDNRVAHSLRRQIPRRVEGQRARRLLHDR